MELIKEQASVLPYDRVYCETSALCSACGQRSPAVLASRGGQVWLSKACPEHGEHEELFEENARFFERQSEYDKPSTPTLKETITKDGCPDDCGLCEAHNQHTCIALLEITQECSYGCPICYAQAGASSRLTIEEGTNRLQKCLDAEGGKLDVLQISGGESTEHPDLLKFIEMALDKGVRYVMLNTNGERLSRDPGIIKDLSRFRQRFEIYLQFDGVTPKASQKLRQKDTTTTLFKALDNLAGVDLPATLVVTVAEEANGQELGEIVAFALKHPIVRGINFQPLTYFGRAENLDRSNRITRTGVIQRLEQQTKGLLVADDFVPLPCDVHNIAITMLVRQGRSFVPVTRKIDARNHLPILDNTLCYYAQDIIKEASGSACCSLKLLWDGLPFISTALKGLASQDRTRFANLNTLRITVSQFRDRFNFEQQAIQKECVHVLAPGGKRIPFSVYNMKWRGVDGY